MSSWRVANLRREPWWPRQPEREQNEWFHLTELPLVRLSDVATVLVRYVPVSTGIPVVRPSDVDGVAGALTAQRLDVREGLRLGDGLRVGDVLVPKAGTRPCVLIDERHRGLAFSSGFLLVRPRKIDPLLLWGLLSSKSGSDVRESAKVDTLQAVLTPASLGAALIPVLSDETAAALCSAMILGGIVGGTVTVDEGFASAWCFRDLRAPGAWWGRDTAQGAADGIPLGKVAQVGLGSASADRAFAVPADARVPVIEADEVRRRPSRQPLWVRRDAHRMTSVNTVLVTRNEPFRLLLASPDHAVAKDLLRIDINEPAADGSGKALAAFLSGPAGQRLLKANATGITIRHLTVRALEELLLPLDWQGTVAQPSESLGARLEVVFEALGTWS